MCILIYIWFCTYIGQGQPIPYIKSIVLEEFFFFFTLVSCETLLFRKLTVIFSFHALTVMYVHCSMVCLTLQVDVHWIFFLFYIFLFASLSGMYSSVDWRTPNTGYEILGTARACGFLYLYGQIDCNRT